MVKILDCQCHPRTSLGQREDASHPPLDIKKTFDSIQGFHHLLRSKAKTYTFLPELLPDMIIKKETFCTRLQHPSPAKGSSLSVKKYQVLLNDCIPSPSPRMISRTNSMILQRSLVRRNSTHEMVVARRRRASKEIVRRALTPPARRLTWRWFDFRPTPSRLSVMSMAT